MEFILFFLVFTLISIAGFVEGYCKSKALKIISFSVPLFLMVALAAFRSVGVGSDDEAYVDLFSRIPTVSSCADFLCGYDYSSLNVEFGFFALLYFLSLLGNSNVLLFGSSALIAVYLNLKSIRFFSPYFSAGVLIYFSHLFLAKELNAIRIGIASAIAFYAVTYLYKKRYVVFLTLMVIAVSIHITLILMLIPALIWNFQLKRSFLCYLAIATVLFASLWDMSNFITPLVNIGFVADKLELYGNAVQYSYAIPLFDLVNIRNMLIVVLCLIYWDRLCVTSDKFRFAFYFFYSAALYRIFLGDFAIVAGRGYGAISMFELVIVPWMIYLFAGNRLGYLLIFFYAFLTLYMNLYHNTAWSGGVSYFTDLL